MLSETCGADKLDRELFFELAEAAEKEQFDDKYLLHLIEFWKTASNEADGNIFYALYALHFGNYTVALEYAEKAYKKRKINLELWRILRDCYFHLGNQKKALLFAGYADKLYAEPVKLDIKRDSLQESLGLFSLGMGQGDYAPIATGMMRLGQNGLEHRSAIFAGEFLPEVYPQRPYHIWAGAYTEQEMLDYKGMLLEKIKDDDELADTGGADFTFDLIKGKEVSGSIEIPVSNHDVVVPVVGTEKHQQIDFFTADESTADWLGKWTTSFFRLDKSAKISSNVPFILGEPIPLHHSPKRKKVVMSILIDALCWKAIKERDYELVPNILDFFKKGIIFDDHYSVAEYTYPSFATIETGMYPQHSQIYTEKSAQVLDPEYMTISEQMKKLGYYCVNVMGCGEGVYNGVARGFDRLISNAYALPTYVGVERTIHQLEAFQECDQFLLLHTMDTHPWGAHTFQLPLTTQTYFNLKERSMKDEKKRTSVYLPNRPLYHHWNEQGIRDVDHALKKLFDYITAHYDEDEYIVQLYSDHGVAIYDDKNYVLSEHQSGAAFMIRGAGIPARGFVDELTSAVDLYPTLAHCVGFPVGENVDGNLPEALGGKARAHVVSMSLFPGSLFMLCVRTKDYECRVESRRILDEDGRTDLDDMKFAVYCRADQQEIDLPELNAYFRKIVDEFTVDINNHGMRWPEMRQKREGWF